MLWQTQKTQTAGVESLPTTNSLQLSRTIVACHPSLLWEGAMLGNCHQGFPATIVLKHHPHHVGLLSIYPPWILTICTASSSLFLLVLPSASASARYTRPC